MINLIFLCSVMHQIFRGFAAAADPPAGGTHQRFFEQIFGPGFFPDKASVHFHVEGNFFHSQPSHGVHNRRRRITAQDNGIPILLQILRHIQAQIPALDHGSPGQLNGFEIAAALNIPVRRPVGLVFLTLGEQDGHIHVFSQFVKKLHPVRRGIIG